ncbi:hypothetical protein DL771_008668 [Monosporascus sp. 5C6A]|nr:hypothetical protein DL771_008668 [Monosporascus sp. 5C6A]
MAPRWPLSGLLAMPPSIRPLLLLASTIQIQPLSPPLLVQTQTRQFSTSPSQYAKFRHSNIAAFSIPEFRNAPPNAIPPEQLFEHAFLLNAPDAPVEEGLRTLFTKTPASFYYGNPDFYHLRKNTRIPEICILGRSNVGKSSLVNALANRQTNELARVSKSAGKTRSINAYGFGPPSQLPKELTGAQYKGKEDLPKHTFYLVDMPGYGRNSLYEWGRNITLYLNKRSAVRGAVLLIDALAGPKRTDWDALNLLGTAGLRTAFVITKADKVVTPDRLRDTILHLQNGIRDIENLLAAENKWTWDTEIYVTAAGARDPAVVSATATTARLAVAKLAGLVGDTRPKEERNRRWGGKVVSFEELMSVPVKATSTARAQNVDTNTLDRPANISSRAPSLPEEDPGGLTSPVAPNTGHASGRQNISIHGPSRPRTDSSLNNPTARNPTTSNPPSRSFHATGILDGSSPCPEELRALIEEFWVDLKANENTARDRARKRKLELEGRSPRPPHKSREQELRHKGQSRFPEQTKRFHMIKENRLRREMMRLQIQEEKQRRKEMGLDYADLDSTGDIEARGGAGRRRPQRDMDDGMDDEFGPPASETSSRFAKGSGSKARGAQKPKPEQEEELDPFEAKFLRKRVGDGGVQDQGPSF